MSRYSSTSQWSRKARKKRRLGKSALETAARADLLDKFGTILAHYRRTASVKDRKSFADVLIDIYSFDSCPDAKVESAIKWSIEKLLNLKNHFQYVSWRDNWC